MHAGGDVAAVDHPETEAEAAPEPSQQEKRSRGSRRMPEHGRTSRPEKLVGVSDDVHDLPALRFSSREFLEEEVEQALARGELHVAAKLSSKLEAIEGRIESAKAAAQQRRVAAHALTVEEQAQRARAPTKPVWMYVRARTRPRLSLPTLAHTRARACRDL